MKAIVVLLVFMSCVGYSHTDAEKRRYVDAILTRTTNVASDDNWASEGRDPDPNNVLESWEGFLGLCVPKDQIRSLSFAEDLVKYGSIKFLQEDS